VLTADEIAALPMGPLGGFEGVTDRQLWTDGASIAGILTISAGHRLGMHAHRLNHHHMWVLEGRAEILGEVLERGGYAHIPGGVAHDIDATATDGCTVLYLYERPSA
jgi:quercetin dioxygenase-like cupin family protein